MVTFHTHTLTFLSSYDISSHPKMIQLITGFIVSRPTQFINWLCTNTDSLSMAGTAKRCKTLPSFTRFCERETEREGDEGKKERRKITALTFKASEVCTCGCVDYLYVYLCVCRMTAHLVATDPISKQPLLCIKCLKNN